MPTVVQKYGGTSVADPQRISKVADRIQRARAEGNDLAVVVSAMGKTTDQLLDLARQITDSPSPRELDMLLTAGERITMALLAMALEKRSVPAVSYTGSQAGVLTDSSHGEARIREITGERVKDSLGKGKVVIVAGFQGVDPESKEVTTLGRGGSDTTAVALAATLGAVACEILTDVDGVFTADPRVVPGARMIREISFDDMIALARHGAAVLADHSVEHAKDRDVAIHVRSSFKDDGGTWVGTVAPASSVVGLARKTVGESGYVTVVGAIDDDVVEEASAALGAARIDAEVFEVTPTSLTFAVTAELQDNAMRQLHVSLGLNAHEKEDGDA